MEKKARGRRRWWEVEDEGGSFDADHVEEKFEWGMLSLALEC